MSFKRLIEFSIHMNKQFIPSNLNELKLKLVEKSKIDFSAERGRLRADPRNQIKRGIFGLGGISWTTECNNKCNALDDEERSIWKLREKLDEYDTIEQTIEKKINELSLVETQIQKLLWQKELIARRRFKHEELKVRAKRNDDEVRAMAFSVKKNISDIEHDCPYCGGGLGLTPHADHIYPVAKGGLSVTKNMVMVCAKCNLKKKDLTLREFISKFSMNRDEIEERLEKLGKSF